MTPAWGGLLARDGHLQALAARGPYRAEYGATEKNAYSLAAVGRSRRDRRRGGLLARDGHLQALAARGPYRAEYAATEKNAYSLAAVGRSRRDRRRGGLLARDGHLQALAARGPYRAEYAATEKDAYSLAAVGRSRRDRRRGGMLAREIHPQALAAGALQGGVRATLHFHAAVLYASVGETFSPGMSTPILSAQNITKRFPGVVALKDVSFDLLPGEIHALCGENGAGKSTLIKLLSGIHPQGSFEGALLVDGNPAEFRSIADAKRAGISVIYQELALVDGMTVAENIFLGTEPRRFGLVDWGRVYRDTRALLERFKLDIDPSTPCERLGIGQKQLVEIVKALSKNSRILILDEPTAALAEHEVQILLGILRDLRSRGIACIYISHKLEEVFAIADRITVLRDGATIVTKDVEEISKGEVIQRMVGREIQDLFPRRTSTTLPGTDYPEETKSDAEVLRVEHLSVADPHTGKLRLRDISFSVRPGEVLGLGGLMGAGRTELLMHLFGAWGVRRGGCVELLGQELPPVGPVDVLRRGLALVSEDRRRYGLVLDESINFNLSLSSLGRVKNAGLIDQPREFQSNQRMFSSLRVKAPSLDATVGKLSGGNQQKVVLGKALLAQPSVIFLDEPTRGIDVGAKLEIYQLINQLTDDGKAVVLVSSELPELIGMSDRILMLREGRIGGEFTRAEATQEGLMAAAIGQPLATLI